MSERTGLVQGRGDLAKAVAGELTRYKVGIEQSMPAAARAMITPERAVRLIMNETRRLPALLECSPVSLIGGMLTAASLGLEIGAHLGQAYLVPFKGQATFVLGYKGMITLAHRSGHITSLVSNVVYEGDEFSMELGSKPNIHHVPELDGDRGKPRLYYACATLTNGGVIFDRPLTLADVEKIRQASPGSRNPKGPWATWPEEMARKSAVRRLSKYLPLSPDMGTALSIDDALDQGRRPELPPSLDFLAGAPGISPGEEIGGDEEDPRSFSGTVVDGATAQGDDR